MKPLFRILNRTWIIASFLLCATCIVLWVKSYERVHIFEPANTHQWIYPDTWFELGSDAGSLYFLRVDGVDMRDSAEPESNNEKDNLIDRVVLQKTPGEYYKLRMRFKFLNSDFMGSDTGDSIRSMAYLDDLQRAREHPALAKWQEGKAFSKIGSRFFPPNHRFPYFQLLTIRYWLLALLLALSPAIWTFNFIRHFRQNRRRNRAGYCPACGYDLRATPRRCPECGLAVTPATETKS